MAKNQFLIPEDHVITLLSQSQITHEKMRQALVLVLTHAYEYREAAEKVGLPSHQMLGRRARELRDRYIETHRPEGWLLFTTFYPENLQKDVDLLKAKIIDEKVKKNNRK